MLKETSDGDGVAAVVQDALTGEILWVGHLQSGAPKVIAETGIVKIPDLSEGDPLAVRHLSSRGEGLVIHVDGPCTRRQLDSMMPEAENPFSDADLSELSQTLTARLDSGKWSKPAVPDVAEARIGTEATLDESTLAFSLVKTCGKKDLIAEHAAAVLGSLFTELREASVSGVTLLEALRKRGYA